jgi:tetratricopeptide (TPR) repeat protein
VEAEDLCRQATARCEKLVRWPEGLRTEDQFALVENRLGMTELWLARTLAKRGRPKEAGESFERAMPFFRKSRQNPAVARHYGHLLRECRSDYSLFLAETGHPDEAERQFRQDLEPGDTRSRAALAWKLAAHPDAKVRTASADLAVKLAKEAADLAPDDGNILNTLGTALYRAGRWDDAIEALEKPNPLSGGKQLGHNAFFIAMAHWQLGRKDEARQWYDRAVEWMDKNKRNEAELIRFRAEAATLLGVTEGVPPGVPTSPATTNPQRSKN